MCTFQESLLLLWLPWCLPPPMILQSAKKWHTCGDSMLALEHDSWVICFGRLHIQWNSALWLLSEHCGMFQPLHRKCQFETGFLLIPSGFFSKAFSFSAFGLKFYRLVKCSCHYVYLFLCSLCMLPWVFQRNPWNIFLWCGYLTNNLWLVKIICCDFPLPACSYITADCATL